MLSACHGAEARRSGEDARWLGALSDSIAVWETSADRGRWRFIDDETQGPLDRLSALLIRNQPRSDPRVAVPVPVLDAVHRWAAEAAADVPDELFGSDDVVVQALGVVDATGRAYVATQQILAFCGASGTCPGLIVWYDSTRSRVPVEESVHLRAWRTVRVRVGDSVAVFFVAAERADDGYRGTVHRLGAEMGPVQCLAWSGKDAPPSLMPCAADSLRTSLPEVEDRMKAGEFQFARGDYDNASGSLRNMERRAAALPSDLELVFRLSAARAALSGARAACATARAHGGRQCP